MSELALEIVDLFSAPSFALVVKLEKIRSR